MPPQTPEDYPRPSWCREPLQWAPLNSHTWDNWTIAFDDEDTGLQQGWASSQGIPEGRRQKINVPFVYQTPASGINAQKAHPIVWYQVPLYANTDLLLSDKDWRTILHFEAADYKATVFLQGQKLGEHRGGHTPFSFDVTGILDEREATQLVIRIEDSPTDLTQPRGKQYWGPKPEGIFYTPSTGIWGNVWFEHVPNTRIADSSHGTVLRSNDIQGGVLDAEIVIEGLRTKDPLYVTLRGGLAGIDIANISARVEPEQRTARLALPLRLSDEQISLLPTSFASDHPAENSTAWHDNLALWSPEHPILYDLTITLSKDPEHRERVDTVHTTAGMRSLSWSNGDGTFRLNDRAYFHALVLDQGYWPETNMTPPAPTSCKEDILLAKAMGFNGCRKHQKVESPEFLYWADRLGFMVWSEMGNAYEFSQEYVERFDSEWKEAVKRDRNHPCVVAWTPVNESWGYGDLKGDGGQRAHISSLYWMTKTLDATRPINDNCGWEHVCTDLTTFHDYADGEKLKVVCADINVLLGAKAEGRRMFVGDAKHVEGMPILCTEFGGVNIKLKEGEQGVDGEWGYTTATDSKDLLERVRKLMLDVVEGGHCCGFVYTQLTDIEQETNGLYTFDRKEKLPAAEVKKIIEDAKSAYCDRLKQKPAGKV